MIYFFLSLELIDFWKEITRNQFTAQPQRDKHTSSIHIVVAIAGVRATTGDFFLARNSLELANY